jgi:hypothetical protein
VGIADHDGIDNGERRQQECPCAFLMVWLRESNHQPVAPRARFFERFQMPRGYGNKTIGREADSPAIPLP